MFHSTNPKQHVPWTFILLPTPSHNIYQANTELFSMASILAWLPRTSGEQYGLSGYSYGI